MAVSLTRSFEPRRHAAQDGQKKFIEVETAAQMLGVALPDGPLTARFQEFLGEQTEYKVVSADQWLGIYRFSREVCCPHPIPKFNLGLP